MRSVSSREGVEEDTLGHRTRQRRQQMQGGWLVIHWSDDVNGEFTVGGVRVVGEVCVLLNGLCYFDGFVGSRCDNRCFGRSWLRHDLGAFVSGSEMRGFGRDCCVAVGDQVRDGSADGCNIIVGGVL